MTGGRPLSDGDHLMLGGVPTEGHGFSYFVGALFFNVNCVASFLAHGVADEELWAWAPAVVGSFGFVVGGLVECRW